MFIDGCDTHGIMVTGRESVFVEVPMVRITWRTRILVVKGSGVNISRSNFHS